MKLLLFLFTTVCSAQIAVIGEVPEVKTLSQGKFLGIEITYKEGNPNVYVITYQNRMYGIPDIRTIGFEATPEDMDKLYHEWNSLYSGDSEKKYVLGQYEVHAVPKKGVVYFYVSHPGETDAYFSLKHKNLPKAFGVKTK